MPKIKHVNLKDAEGFIYCCLRNKLLKLDEQHQETYCSRCPMFAGTAGGTGIECEWNDLRALSHPYVVQKPYEEYLSVQTRKIDSLHSSLLYEYQADGI